MFIYGIYVNEELWYVGKTTRALKKRFLEHKRNMENVRKGNYEGSQYEFYSALVDAKDLGQNINMRVLIDTNEVMVNKEIYDYDLQWMELGLISALKPKYNIEGIKKEYKFR